MNEDNSFKACEQHGAKRVYDAAYARLLGDYKALRAVGLPRIVDLGEANTHRALAYRCLRVENQALSVAGAGVPPTPR